MIDQIFPRAALYARTVSLALAVAMLVSPSHAFSPTDMIPRSSGVYDALALLASRHALPDSSLNAQDFTGLTAPPRTRAQAEAIVGDAPKPADARSAAALAYLRRVLFMDGADASQSTASSGVALLGSAAAELGIRREVGGHALTDLYGEARAVGASGAFDYSAGVSNQNRWMHDHDSFATAGPGESRGGQPQTLDGLQEALVTYTDRRDLRLTAGWLRERWGTNERGGVLVNDDQPAEPTLEADLPFRLLRGLPAMHIRQYVRTVNNLGRTIYQNGRRIDLPLGDRVDLSLQEAASSTRIRTPAILVLPYYLYQRFYIHNNLAEPNEFNYNASIDLNYRPYPGNADQRVYVEFMLDDIQAPTGFGLGDKVPRKIAYVAGYADRFARTGTDAVLEYYYADQTTYTKPEANRAALGWFNDGLPEGHPGGPNAREISFRIGQKLSRDLNLTVAARRRDRVTPNFPAPSVRSLDLALSYQVTPTATLALRYADYREHPFPGPDAHVAIGGGADYGSDIRRRIIGFSVLSLF